MLHDEIRGLGVGFKHTDGPSIASGSSSWEVLENHL